MKTVLTKLWVRLAVAFLVAGFIYYIAFHFDWFSFVDRTTYDLGVALRSQPGMDPAVVLIAIDARSLRECFPAPPFPVSRHLDQHARLIQRLDSAGAELIVFDILFDQLEGVERESLDLFALSLGESQKVVLACAAEKEDLVDGSGRNAMSAERFCAPPEQIRRAAAGVGHINVPLDSDGQIRRIYLHRRISDSLVPSLAYAAADLYWGDGRALPEPICDTLLIDYSWAIDAIESVPYRAVISGSNWRLKVRGKIAVVGVTENGSIDTYKTPLSIISDRSSGRMPGVEIQSIALQTLISGTGLVQPSAATVLIVGMVLLLVILRTIAGARPLIGFLVAGGALIILLAATVLSTAVLRTAVSVAPLLLATANGTVFIIVLNMIALKAERDYQAHIMADVEADLLGAQDIQKKLQPLVFPEGTTYEVAGIQIPCKEVGGDYYDVIELENNRLGILVADVAGKGVGGSLIMSNLQGCFRQVAPGIQSPAEVFLRLNDVVKSVAVSRHFFVTALYGILDPDKKMLTYSNAGHGYPVICSHDGKISLLEGGEVPLGILPDNQWTSHEISLDIGDIMCLYTDGISEASKGGSDEMFGEEGIQACLMETCGEPAQTICDYLLYTCRQFTGREEFDDDWTVLILRFLGPNSEIT